MYEQTALLVYRFRMLFVGLFALSLLAACSAVITAAGSNTILDARSHPTVSAPDASVSDSPNAVTSAASTLGQNLQSGIISLGRSMYATCQFITDATAQAGRSVVHGTATVLGGIWDGIAFVGRGIGGGVMFAVRLPGKLVASITHAHTVNAIVRPSDTTQVPVIDDKTSAAELANLNAEQRQKIAALLAAQLAANESLEGVVVAGDTAHGGYPAKWDNAAQDSVTDSWGMYNRECVSYVAWKVYQTYGHMPYWGGFGNANQWVADARSAGIATGSIPIMHAVAISRYGYYGHAMWVEAVKGNMIYVSQYNYDLHGHYSEMWVNGSGLTYLYFK